MAKNQMSPQLVHNTDKLHACRYNDVQIGFTSKNKHFQIIISRNPIEFYSIQRIRHSD